jgi:hypothetical protein
MNCDLCKCEFSTQVYTIPMDAQSQRISGSFCSLKHALHANRYQNTDSRLVAGWEDREKWLIDGSPSKELLVPEKVRW